MDDIVIDTNTRRRTYRRNGDGLTGETGTELQEKRQRTYSRDDR